MSFVKVPFSNQVIQNCVQVKLVFLIILNIHDHAFDDKLCADNLAL